MENIYLPSEVQLRQWGEKLMHAILNTPRTQGVVIYLNGDLGAGKTCLSRAMIQSLGFQGRVKSPTYTLVEEYDLPEIFIYHFDLYRLADPEELAFMGIRDYFNANTLCLIEWSSQGQGFLPPADLVIDLQYVDDARSLAIRANTPMGNNILNQLR
ncbi:tRNA (adenosine(37)-N6)-threonylcarbamoyltransferase complex ATPase subunit type 1 TsaE [Actinobacillus delphinicola]|uniref:tRNA threonylcarbamoyladenosine biosynthesis protein TsaE n=1 Tax=Actinobacillus delphinicola TaxID=51161 RepID=A0A448TRZ6_9PAST|nr:tRNA (adenosine(37)-N6)-threonylcarbamoyltransferase complex ATPase subunit type 1 TsaE [Actinobacillus delphinicola]VEJ08665.1 ATP-binding protein [Actinobacillus delphinicola]